MKTKKYYVTVAIIAGILCALARAEMDLSDLAERPVLLGRANPTLAGIDKLHVTIIHPAEEPNGFAWEKLKAQINNKLNEAGIEVFSPEPGVMYKLPIWPELKICVDMLKLEQSQQYVFRIQPSLARTVYLAKEQILFFKADVWKTEPAMQVASIQNTPATVTNAVLEQTGTFITAYLDANPKGSRAADPNQIGISQKRPTMPAAKSEVAEYKYVASKNSKVFHNPECSWAKRIKPENLVHYKTRDDVINAGKRPCKMCKP